MAVIGVEYDPMTGARVWIDKCRDSLYTICNRIAQEFPHLPEPYIGFESLNEVYPSLNAAHVQRAAIFDGAFIEALVETGLPIRPIVFCAAVGNPHESEYPLLVPLARDCAAADGWFGYHAYWLGNPDYGGPGHLWPYLSGRWTEMDKLFTQHDAYVTWYSGECGVVGGRSSEGEAGLSASAFCPPNAELRAGLRDNPDVPYLIYTGLHTEEIRHRALANGDWVSLWANAGWKDNECYQGNWTRYLADILEWDRRVREWNLLHGDRFVCGTLFTTGDERYTGWAEFQVQQREMEAIVTALLERYDQ